MSTGRQRAAVLVLGGLGAALVLFSVTRPWLSVRVDDPVAGLATLRPTGRAAAPLVAAVALVALAASLAAVTLRRVGRQVAGLLLVAAAGSVGAACLGVLRDPAGAARDSVRNATGRTGAVPAVATTTGWPWLAIAAAVALLAAGALTIVAGRGWSGLSSRYDASPGQPAASPARAADAALADPDEAWDAVSRGEDPTAP